MIVGQPARAHAGKLGSCRGQRPAGTTRRAGHGNRLRRPGKLAVDGGERGLGGSKIAVDAAQFGARGLEPLERSGTALHHLGMLALEDGTAPFGGFQLLLAIRELLVHEIERLGHLTAPAGHVFLAEDVDHLLDDVLRQLGVLGLGQRSVVRLGGDLEEIVLLADHLDRLGEAEDRRFHLLGRGDLVAQRGRAHDLLEVDRTGQGLLHAVDVAAAVVEADADLLGERIVELDKNTRPRFVAVGHHGDHQPAEQADAPGDGQGQPAPVPDAVDRCAQFVVDRIHRVSCLAALRTCFQG